MILKDVKVDPIPKVDFIFKRSFSQENILKFHNATNSVDWANLVCTIADPQDSFTKFHTKYTNLYNTFFPLKKVKIGYTTKKTMANFWYKKLNQNQKQAVHKISQTPILY